MNRWVLNDDDDDDCLYEDMKMDYNVRLERNCKLLRDKMEFSTR